MLTRTAANVDVHERITLADGMLVQFTAGGQAVLECRGRQVRLRIGHDAVRSNLRRLVSAPCDPTELMMAVDRVGDLSVCLQWSTLLDRLDRLGALDRLAVAGDEVLARLHAVGSGSTMVRSAGDDVELRPEGFSEVRITDGRPILKSARSHLAVELSPGGLGLWAAASGVRGAGNEVMFVPELFRDVLFTAGILLPCPDSAHPESVWWSSAEWALHQQSRDPATVAGFAATDRFHGRRKPPEPGLSLDPVRVQPLAVPALATRLELDPPLARVMEERRSRRHHEDSAPITREQLGELLYRTARYRATFQAATGQILVDRPVPAGGSIHELEVFPVVQKCAGLEPGMWHYNGSTHELELVCTQSSATDRIVGSAASASVMTGPPQVVLVLAASFGRLMHKYEAIGYTLIAKHVGVFQQSVYLVAEAMGLATCALGAGEAPAFADASGFDELELSSVGEMTLGSRAKQIEGGI